MNDNIEYEYDGLNNRISLRFPYKVYIHPRTGINLSDGNDLLSDSNDSSKNVIEQTRYKKQYYLNDYTTNTDTYIAIKIDSNNYRYTTIGNNNSTISTNNSYLLSDYQGSIVLSLSKDNPSNINTISYSDYGVSNIDNNPLDNKNISISYTNQDYFFLYVLVYHFW